MAKRYRFGWGDCAYCGRSVGATKDGRAIRHGFIRVRKGYKRIAFPELKSGSTGYACKGSGLPFVKDSWYKLY